jgi:23S rRNA (pseudouridine1915-N3)-methyltransferase
MPDWIEQGYEEYARRLKGECTLSLKEIPPGKRGKSVSVSRTIEEEGQRLLGSIPKGAHVVALDVLGKAWSTEQLASSMTRWMQQGQTISLLVGGPEGLSEACVQRADQRWSLSALTFPHPLVRVIVAEQLYRAYSINKNHPYHRAG